jgi:hypothetical protein
MPPPMYMEIFFERGSMLIQAWPVLTVGARPFAAVPHVGLVQCLRFCRLQVITIFVAVDGIPLGARAGSPYVNGNA